MADFKEYTAAAYSENPFEMHQFPWKNVATPQRRFLTKNFIYRGCV